MIVKQKQFEIACNKYAELFNSPDRWDSFCIAKDSWLAGLKWSLSNDMTQIDNISEVDVGNQQIGMNDKYNSRDKSELLREALLLHFGCNDVRIHKDNNGTISFQGVIK